MIKTYQVKMSSLYVFLHLRKLFQMKKQHFSYCIIPSRLCDQKVLRVKHVDLQKALKKHDYNIALISTAILSDLKTYEEIKNIAHAIKKFGFDEVVR